jgi:two-component system, response regulator YesN
VSSLLVVDDERIIREGIAREFRRFGFDVMQAADGEEALALLRRERVDAMILDLKMPKVDGLELLRLLSSEGIEDIVTVILTGYSELSYAREAIRYGVTDYLLKPLVPEEVEQLSRELLQKIGARDRISEERMHLLKQVEESKPVLKERLFWDLVGQQVDPESVKERLEFLGMGFPRGFFQVILLELGPGGRAGADPRRKRSITLMKALENRIRDFFAEQGDITVFHLSTQMFALLVNCRSGECDPTQNEPMLERLTQGVANDLGLAMTVSVGRIVEGIESISTSYYDALGTLSYREMLGDGAIMESADFLDNEDSRRLAFPLEEVTFLVKTEQMQKLTAHVQNTFEMIARPGHRFELTTVYLTSYKYICAILNAPLEYGIHVDELYRGRPNPLHQGEKQRTLEEMRGWILQTAREVVDCISEFRRNRNTTIVERVKAFIAAHFAQDISGAILSQALGMSPNYLGQVFKRETGVSVHDYLNDFRIEEAKRLLKTTNLLVFEIAFKVGYRDQQYFSAVFRKRVGLTPKEYREA